ncbi:hypothetical protein M3210_09175 [Oceanobacillus luteolus]|uniref:HAAS signaling domain-containing protein n=1 Tax=Oceanobacillus luteolus TaxID=1274358 RepID=UPI00204227E1|nr:hypothetical protein [Oceanobacillus luteolus]MCM3740441.1 hypothetical protein [Oceanobacillus luteolus]
MELIDRYIYAVTQKIPTSQRKDIEKELRGLIEDMLEERTQGKQATEKEIEEVLLELGNPRELALQYRGTKRFLIGPELFDSYLLVLRIVLISVGAIIASVFVIKTMLNPISILDYFIECIVSAVTGLPSAFGWTTLGFAIAERASELKAKDLQIEKKWTPKDLPTIPQTGTIKRSEPIVGIIFYTVLLLFFLSSMNYFGIWTFRDGFSGAIPFINVNADNLFILFIIITLGFGILKESLKLIYGRWNLKIVLFTLILNTLSLLLVIYVINQPDFWNPNFMEQLVEHNLVQADSEAFTIIQNIWEQLTKWVPILFAVGLVWDVIDGLYRVRKANK